MSIKDDFEKYDSLIQEKKDIAEDLDKIREELLEIKKISQKDPFVFLQQSNAIDVHHKNQRLTTLRAEEIIKELDEFPQKVQKKLGDAVLGYFSKKEEDALQAAIAQEKQAQFYRVLKLGAGGSLGVGMLVGLAVVATKALRSRK